MVNGVALLFHGGGQRREAQVGLTCEHDVENRAAVEGRPLLGERGEADLMGLEGDPQLKRAVQDLRT